MKCPKCPGTGWVMGSREKDGSVRRRRVCRKCGYRWTTSEIPIDSLKDLIDQAATIAKTISKM